jgi:hypothetical protein
MHQRGVLQLEQRRFRHAKLPPHGHCQHGDPSRVAGLDVPADLRDASEGADRLQVGGPDAGVPAQRDLRDQQRRGKHGDGEQPHDLGREGDQQR